MSDILSKLQKVHSDQKMVKVPVPEYGLELYFPPLTVSDHAKIRRGVPKNDEAALMVSGLIHMACDENGARVFDVPKKDKPALVAELHKMPLEILQRIVVQSGGGLPDSVASEVVEVDAAQMRAMLSTLTSEGSQLCEAVQSVDESVLRAALSDIAQAHLSGRDQKNS